MTKINRLTIHGFKSFAHKTDIPFNNEFNCILGPNGSGKSNIGDAMCFVLGRISAKSMRAEKAANLIFNGGKSKKPANSGTVEMAFCNKNKVFPTDDKEVVIGRTITKKGSSIYKINGKKRTRSEIVELMGNARINPDGYNIILQGDITRFVTMSSTERRKIIEGISDVAIYEEKKHKADLELNKVEEKLNSAAIILKERKVYLKELKKDRDQALQFKEVKDKIDSHKATYLDMQIKEKETIHAKHLGEVQKHETRLKEAEEKVDVLKAEILKHKEEISAINKDIEQKGEKEQVKVHKEIEDLKVSVTRDKTRMSTLKDEINKIKLRKDQFKQELKDLELKTSGFTKKQKEMQDAVGRKQRELNQLNGKIAEFRKKNKIETSQELDQDIEAKDKLIDVKQEEVQQIRQRQQELLREKDKIEYQLETLDERINKVKEVASENKEQVRELQQLKTNFKNATLRLNTCLDQDSSFTSQLANARRNLQDVQEKHANLNAKAMNIKAGIASNNAVRSILENKTMFKGVHGTVGELGQVNKRYAQALETAAGSRMNFLVVDNDGIAADCIKYLKSNKLGSASFIPLNKIRYREVESSDKSLLKESGTHDFAINLISYKSQYKKAFQSVFGNTLIVEDINAARNVGVGKIKMTTLDGSSIESSGVMRGGFMAKKRSGGFQERDSLEALERVEGEIAEYQSILSNIQTKRGVNEEEISALRKSKAEMEGSIITLEKTLHLNTDDLDATKDLKKELKENLIKVDDELREVMKNISMNNRDLADLKSKKNILRSQVTALRNPRLLAQMSAFEESRQGLREDILRLESDLKNGAIQVDQMLAPERIKILEIMKQHEKEESEFTTEISGLNTDIKEKDAALNLKEKASKEFYAKYKELFNKREKLSSFINTSDNKVESLRDKSRVSERELNLISLKNAEVKAKLAGLQEEFERYKEAPLLKNKQIDELRKEVARFEVILSQMSAVNMKALEIYEKVETEYTALVDKRESLIGEKTDVMTLMNEIETKKKEHFMTTFNKANENFTKVFGNLFNKGKAFLQLDNPNKPFDDGLSIKVKLSGNRYMDLKSLSGGEKTLTALSFIFAIQEYQPASFYILDEIDAALDKHNAERLAKLIRNYSNGAQYITISHNDSVISEADTLFGVSMKEGVSKVTSLEI
ncbi:chromosome segregation protein SMC [Candidatus Woesearchaeota archaeon]|jgi:chromosome segregation protein|nr:chromosome segregation protein SMC [Candidatus Woesearchaeota archaeon]MBT4150380.1 chromosome segregation protein SMC [Candidatus Woesearchaeota archaeon]MBT4247380.1 chromosome segregation protein SMC [Candidatus Woesearchaeota archaeon]MBT4434565.1 chromosome segregation protein SMC [Candidatus Woesearchaeota archaeon]MBT7332006.1 chromosome segregation protein SMC [Candidatus Woesearchaeota archaeon]